MHLKLFSWSLNKKTGLLGKPKPLTQNRKTGNWAEGLAAEDLRKKKMRILARNWTYKNDELDIIAQDGEGVVFVEVRARSAKAHVPGYFTLGGGKRTALRRAINAYLHEHGEVPWRFDVVEVSYSSTKDYEVKHYEGVRL